MEYEYSVLVGNTVRVPFGTNVLEGRAVATYWVKDINKALVRAGRLREVNPKAQITIEISPWYWDGKIAYCPGCEYSACPVGGK